MLKLEPGRTTINPAGELTRNSSGYMQGEGGADTFHGLRVDVLPPVIAHEYRPPPPEGWGGVFDATSK